MPPSNQKWSSLQATAQQLQLNTSLSKPFQCCPYCLTCPPGRRKFAVVFCLKVGGGIFLFPSAIPTMAVMWVSGPNTCIGTPSVSPRILAIKALGERLKFYLVWTRSSQLWAYRVLAWFWGPPGSSVQHAVRRLLPFRPSVSAGNHAMPVWCPV